MALRLGLSDIGLQTFALRDGADVVVQQLITNYSDQPVTYTAYAQAPGAARQERIVAGLPPGVSTIRRYRLAVAPTGSAIAVRSGLRELDGVRVLNDIVEVE